MLMRSGLGPTERRSREFLSIKLPGAARPTCTSRRWRLSFPSSCAVLVMMPNTQGRGRRGAGCAYTAARASASWRTRAGARPRRPSSIFSIDQCVRARSRASRTCSLSLLFREQFYVVLRSWSGQLAASVSESMQVPLPSPRRVLVSAVARCGPMCKAKRL